MARRIVAGNWKMNTTPKEGLLLVSELSAQAGAVPTGVELIVCPPLTHLAPLGAGLPARIALGAQDCSAHERGAFTGEVSASMLSALGVSYVIVGHSERRMYHGEDDGLLLSKVLRAHEAGLKAIFCVGEPLEERDRGDENAWDYVLQQLGILRELPSDCLCSLVVAYEPIWAIGTGRTATPEQAGAMCLRIEEHLSTLPQREGADPMPVLYGGSCNAANAQELFARQGISGGLIGGASLKAADFIAIAQSF